MYGWIWQHLPGPVPVRILISIVVVVAVLVLLFLWVFPWVESQIEFDNSQVSQSVAQGSSEFGKLGSPVLEGSV